jgi:hypothetical protein
MISYRSNRPQPAVHDRKAKDVSRGMAGFIRECEVTDPYDASARISVIRSVRNDPLADRHARHFITDVQYEAGRRFQQAFEIASRGPRSMPLAERVDGTPQHTGLSDAQLKAQAALAKAYAALGQSGTILAKALLVDAMTLKQVGASRGLQGKAWEIFLGKRLEEVLDTLAQVFGLVTAR